MGNKTAAAELAAALYKTKKDPSNADLYNWGMANYQAGNYKSADTIFCGIYESKYPNEIFGYLWCARSKQAQDDTLNSKDWRWRHMKNLAQMGRTLPDSAKYKAQVVQAYFYLASYYNDIKKDKPKAISYMQKVLEVDPSNASCTEDHRSNCRKTTKAGFSSKTEIGNEVINSINKYKPIRIGSLFTIIIQTLPV